MLLLGLSLQGVHAAEERIEVVPEGADIVVKAEEDKTLYEYRINGELIQVRVVPKVGPEYYLVPQDDGSLRRSDRPRLLLPSWKILEW
ncbi:MAG: DUF2782 domain-containing protein [Gammaproteobacteria bacterium]|nr:MAG: DUF2782 domain-containing protein [Gammaproteobacteria bacterium]